jgi:hypothetical protein
VSRKRLPKFPELPQILRTWGRHLPPPKPTHVLVPPPLLLCLLCLCSTPPPPSAPSPPARSLGDVRGEVQEVSSSPLSASAWPNAAAANSSSDTTKSSAAVGSSSVIEEQAGSSHRVGVDAERAQCRRARPWRRKRARRGMPSRRRPR